MVASVEPASGSGMSNLKGATIVSTFGSAAMVSTTSASPVTRMALLTQYVV